MLLLRNNIDSRQLRGSSSAYELWAWASERFLSGRPIVDFSNGVFFILRTVMTILQFMQFPNHTLRILGDFFVGRRKCNGVQRIPQDDISTIN